jgi:hypothetical protein
MLAPDIVEFLTKLGGTRFKQSRSYVNSTCPLAQWKHQKGYDTHPSFGVKIVPDGPSGFYCMSATCGAKGSDLKELVWAIQMHSGRDMSEMIRFVYEHEKHDVRQRVGKKVLTYERLPPVDIGGVRVTADQARKILGTNLDELQKGVELVPDEEAALWKKPVPAEVKQWAREFLEKRKLTLTDARFWELGVVDKVPYVDKNLKQKWFRSWRVIFPVRDCKQRLVGWSGRLIDQRCACRDRVDYSLFEPYCLKCKKFFPGGDCVEHGKKEMENACPSCRRTKPSKFFHRQKFLRNLFLYGEHKRVEEERRAILVEGFADVMGLYRMGYRNVFAVMGGSMSPVHQQKLSQWVDEVIVVPDGDQPGIEIGERIKKALGQVMPVRVVMPPNGLDPGEMSKEEFAKLVNYEPAYSPLDEIADGVTVHPGSQTEPGGTR